MAGNGLSNVSTDLLVQCEMKALGSAPFVPVWWWQVCRLLTYVDWNPTSCATILLIRYLAFCELIARMD